MIVSSSVLHYGSAPTFPGTLALLTERNGITRDRAHIASQLSTFRDACYICSFDQYASTLTIYE